MEAIRNLYSTRSCPACCFSVLAATIPAHYLHTRMLPDPVGERVRAAVGQNIHQFTTFEIHQNGPVASSTTESEVIHAQNPRRLVILKLRSTNMVEQGISRDRDPEVFQKT
jgi:hypothetical protein